MASARWTSEQLETRERGLLEKRLNLKAKQEAPKVSETKVQQGVVKEFALRYPEIYSSGALFAVPNQGKRNRANASRMKAEGMVSGVADLILLWPVADYCGACIEMKEKGGKISPEQSVWLAQRKISGYAVAVCWSHEEAMKFFDDYLNNSKP